MDGESYNQDTGEIIERRTVPAVSGERNLIFASPECGEIFGALAEAQGKMANPKKTKTAKVQGTTKAGGSYSYDYKYAPLEEVVDVIRKPMSEAGLIYRQFLAQRDGNWVMRTVIAHKTGQWFGCDYPLFADRPGAQGFASGVTYARRYGLMLALGLVGEDDDDANVADGNQVAVAAAPSGRTAPKSLGGGQSAHRGPQAAPAPSADKQEAIKRYREIRSEIDASMTVPEVEAIVGCPAWVTMEKMIRACESAEVADTTIQRLRDRIESRKAMISGDGGY